MSAARERLAQNTAARRDIEKDVVLQIALQLRDRINAQPNMRAMLTRDDDFFVRIHALFH